MTQERIELGHKLQKEREDRSLTRADVARVTKIPERVLENLEAGAWDALPAEVFVRGFLKSYCRVVGLDPDETVRSYGELMKARRPAVREVPTLTRPQPVGGDREAATVPAPEPVKRAEPPAAPAQPREEQSLLAALAEASRGSSRTSLTVAVIILVIVATLTLSILLRRPSHVGDGVSQASGTELVAG